MQVRRRRRMRSKARWQLTSVMPNTNRAEADLIGREKRNGASPKVVRIEVGEVTIRAPYDRTGTFEAKMARRLGMAPLDRGSAC